MYKAEDIKKWLIDHQQGDEKSIYGFDELIQIIKLFTESPIPTGEDVQASELQQEFKELNIYLRDIYHHHVYNVKDAGNLWIQFSDKFRAFEKRVLAFRPSPLPLLIADRLNDLNPFKHLPDETPEEFNNTECRHLGYFIAVSKLRELIEGQPAAPKVSTLINALKCVAALSDDEGASKVAQKALDEYNSSVSSITEHTASVPDSKVLVDAIQNLFDERERNPKNKGQGLKNAWNRLAMVLHDYKNAYLK